MGITFRTERNVAERFTGFHASCSCGWRATRVYTVTDTALAVSPLPSVEAYLLQSIATNDPHTCAEVG